MGPREISWWNRCILAAVCGIIGRIHEFRLGKTEASPVGCPFCVFRPRNALKIAERFIAAAVGIAAPRSLFETDGLVHNDH